MQDMECDPSLSSWPEAVTTQTISEFIFDNNSHWWILNCEDTATAAGNDDDHDDGYLGDVIEEAGTCTKQGCIVGRSGGSPQQSGRFS